MGEGQSGNISLEAAILLELGVVLLLVMLGGVCLGSSSVWDHCWGLVSSFSACLRRTSSTHRQADETRHRHSASGRAPESIVGVYGLDRWQGGRLCISFSISPFLFSGILVWMGARGQPSTSSLYI